MRKHIFNLVMLCPLFLMLISCNEPEPEQLRIKAEIPESIALKSSYSVADTFKFTIVSEEAVIDSIKLFEGSLLHVELGTEQFGSGIRTISLNFLYNPKSIGIKNFELRVKALPHRKNYPFDVEVVE